MRRISNETSLDNKKNVFFGVRFAGIPQQNSPYTHGGFPQGLRPQGIPLAAPHATEILKEFLEEILEEFLEDCRSVWRPLHTRRISSRPTASRNSLRISVACGAALTDMRLTPRIFAGSV